MSLLCDTKPCCKLRHLPCGFGSFIQVVIMPSSSTLSFSSFINTSSIFCIYIIFIISSVLYLQTGGILNSNRPDPDAVELHEGCPSSGESFSTKIFGICRLPLLNPSCALQILWQANFTLQGCAPKLFCTVTWHCFCLMHQSKHKGERSRNGSGQSRPG